MNEKKTILIQVKPQDQAQGRLDIEIKKVAINMVKKMEIKDRMIELDSFKYCETHGIPTDQTQDSYTEKVPPEVLEQFSKRWSKTKCDMSQVRIHVTMMMWESIVMMMY